MDADGHVAITLVFIKVQRLQFFLQKCPGFFILADLEVKYVRMKFQFGLFFNLNIYNKKQTSPSFMYFSFQYQNRCIFISQTKIEL